MNKQQMMYVQTLFGSFNGNTQMIHVTDKYGTKFSIEVYPSNNLIAFKLHFDNGESSVWSTWASEDEVERFFRRASLL